MNAVTTAEYVVLEATSPMALQAQINKHAAMGYKVTAFHVTQEVPDNSSAFYDAVMVRNPVIDTQISENTIKEILTCIDAMGWNREVFFSNLLSELKNEEETYTRFKPIIERIAALEGRVNGINHRLDGIERDVNGSESLQHRVGLLENEAHSHSPGTQSNKDAQSITYVLGDLQKRIEEIEAKIDWSK